MIRRHLGETRYAVCASPTYLKTHGVPDTLEELIDHRCLRYVNDGHPLPWTFISDGVLKEIPTTGTFDSDNGDALRVAALSGLGIIYVLRFQIEADIQSNRLRLLFTDKLPPGPIVQAVFTHQRNLSPRVRVFLEFLSAQSAKVLK